MVAAVTDIQYRMAIPLIRSLARSGWQVIATEYSDVPEHECLAFASRHCWKRERMSRQNPVDWLLELPQRLGLSAAPAIIPVGAFTIAALSRSREQWWGKLRTLVPAPAVLDLCNDTGSLLKQAEKAGVRTPQTAVRSQYGSTEVLADAMPLPAVIKYRKGGLLGLKPGERYRIVTTREQLIQEYDRMRAVQDEPLVQEYIEGDGYGVGLLVDEQGGVRDLICHHRLRQYPVTGGPSACCESLWAPGLASTASRLMAAIGYTGIGMVEFRGRPGDYTLMEINPRFWGASPLIDVCGSGFYQNAANLFHRAQAAPFTADKPDYDTGKTMRYFPQDVLARMGLASGRAAKAGQALRALLDLKTKEGLFRASDPMPFWRYMRHTLRRRS